MYDKFQQSPICSGRCLLPFLRQSGGHSCYACRDVYPQCKLQKTVVPTGAVLGQCLRLALVVSASVRHPTLTRSIPSTSCVCLLSVALGMSMDLSGKYSGTCVSTAPVVELTVMSFTVPLVGCIIVATATVVTTCSSSTGFPDSAAPMCCRGVCVAMSCGGGGFTPDGAYDSALDGVIPMTGKFFFNYFQFQEFVRCVCMLNFWFSSNDDICPDNYNYSRFKLKDKRISVAVRSGSCICTVTRPSRWCVHTCSSWTVVTCPLL